MVQAQGVAAQEPAHAGHEIRVGRLDDEVKMIRHEAIGVSPKTRFLAGFSQCF
jgi:hypothetical protein